MLLRDQLAIRFGNQFAGAETPSAYPKFSRHEIAKQFSEAFRQGWDARNSEIDRLEDLIIHLQEKLNEQANSENNSNNLT